MSVLIRAGILALGAVLLIPSGSARGEAAPQETLLLVVEAPSAKETITVLRDGDAQEEDFETYLTQVVLSEMPADFATEALKAQAVAARTFARRQMAGGKHADADVCSQSACCQACLSVDALQERYGAAFDAAWDKASNAVQQTQDEVLTYGGALIDAVYFSCSGGRTEAAVAVWGGEIPYLQSVPSPGEEDAPRETETLTFTAEEFRDRITPARPDADLSGAPETWFGAVRYTAGGGIGTLELGDASFTGTELRRLLGLRSTDIEFSPQEDGVTVTTHGFGHRVGLSQYGAEAMAQAGRRFDEILLHYYQGTEIRRLTLDGEK